MSNLLKIKRVLVSVSDKMGLVPLARLLRRYGAEIISTGGTARALKAARIPVTDVSSVTAFPEMLDGRVKTLHPCIHAGILAVRSDPAHVRTLKQHQIAPIDMVIVNLYPFETTVSQPSVSRRHAIEEIDIGGPSMIRAAAKNYESVAVVVDPLQYDRLAKELKDKQGRLSFATREQLALEAFQRTSCYDVAIARYFSTQLHPSDLPTQTGLILEKRQDLRYGENPHQRAAFYRLADGLVVPGVVRATQLQGKALSYNNIMDADAAWRMAQYFLQPTAVIVKHANPCGVGVARSIAKAYAKAYQSDPVSAFGGIVALNRPLDEKTARALSALFLEVVVAPAFAKGALRILKKKQNLRLLVVPSFHRKKMRQPLPLLDYRPVIGGMLVQDLDQAQLTMSDIKVVTKREPTLGEVEDLFFAWGVVKHVKSNAIVIAEGGRTLGIGAGQMSRVDAVRIAIEKMTKHPKRVVLASDAFFPFPDSIELAKAAGVSAVIQPGGSIRDGAVIQAADRAGMAMVFTGRRHFRH